MKPNLLRFSKEDAGAITVEWVVLTAIAVILALLVMGIFGGAADGRIKVINDGIAEHLG